MELSSKLNDDPAHGEAGSISIVLANGSLSLFESIHIYIIYIIFFFFFAICFLLFMATIAAYDIPGLGAYTTATAMQDPSCACNLHHSSQQCQILNPLSKARDPTATSGFLVRFVNHGNSDVKSFYPRSLYWIPHYHTTTLQQD